jgi:hypothetical protein
MNKPERETSEPVAGAPDKPAEPAPQEEPRLEPLTTQEILGWVELGCWTMVALAPFLYWVNGPAVSTDQFVVRTALVTIALVGGVVIRVSKWRRKSP